MNYLQNNKPLQMVNLYGDGAVCHHTISEEYYQYPKFDLPYILSEIEGLLYRPNPKDPANGLLGVYF
jgi:ubiquitin-protein ligase